VAWAVIAASFGLLTALVTVVLGRAAARRGTWSL
jgi:hypothetical protein